MASRRASQSDERRQDQLSIPPYTFNVAVIAGIVLGLTLGPLAAVAGFVAGGVVGNAIDHRFGAASR